MAGELIKVVHLDHAILFLQQRPFAFGVYLNFRKKAWDSIQGDLRNRSLILTAGDCSFWW